MLTSNCYEYIFQKISKILGDTKRGGKFHHHSHTKTKMVYGIRAKLSIFIPELPTVHPHDPSAQCWWQWWSWRQRGNLPTDFFFKNEQQMYPPFCLYNSPHLEMDAWNTFSFPFGGKRPIFRGKLTVSFREGIESVKCFHHPYRWIQRCGTQMPPRLMIRVDPSPWECTTWIHWGYLLMCLLYRYIYNYIFISYEQRTKPITSAKGRGWNGHRFLCVPYRFWGFGVRGHEMSKWLKQIEAEAAERAAAEEKVAAAAAMKMNRIVSYQQGYHFGLSVGMCL